MRRCEEKPKKRSKAVCCDWVVTSISLHNDLQREELNNLFITRVHKKADVYLFAFEALQGVKTRSCLKNVDYAGKAQSLQAAQFTESK